MSSDNKNLIAKKIKKLLELSKSSNENEAFAAIEKANELMKKHSIASKEVELSCVGKLRIGEDLQLPNWKRILLGGIQHSYGVSTIYSRGKVTLVGEEVDIEISSEIFTYLVNSINRITDRNTEGEPRWYKNQYRNGLAYGLAHKLKETPRIWSSEEVEQKEKNNEEFIQREYKKVRSTSTQVEATKGMRSGMTASSEISLSKQVFASKRKHLC